MTDTQIGILAAGGALVLVLASVLVVLWWRRRRRATLDATLSAVSYDRLSNVVLPKSDDGEILIEHILLTEGGIYVIDHRTARGVVFGGDKMHDWTVIDGGRRYTLGNPQPGLLDRVAAVRQIVTAVPVKGCVVFADEAQFKKGRPAYVCSESDLLDELPRVERRRPSQARAAFDEEWQRLRDAAFGAR